MGKNFLVVGGTSGIGEKLVELLSNEGHITWAASRSANSSESTSGINYVQYDALSDELRLDTDELDGLAYCPGSINLKPFNRLRPEDFREEWNINVMGAIHTIQLALPLLKKADSASIVLFSTVAVAQGMSYHASIAAAKGAVEGLARSLAAELSPKIRINVIAPSIVDTPLASRLLSSEEKKEASGQRHPLRKVGKPEDVAAMAAFLLSDQSGWMTGQVLPVDGGMSSVKLL